jgi:ABC-type transport system involved in cytochrome c biogenesis ATPase subunit
MASSGMLRRVALVRTDVSEERAWLLVTANFPSSPILVTLMMEALCSSETSVIIRATHRYIPEEAILHSHRLETLKSYIALTGRAL